MSEKHQKSINAIFTHICMEHPELLGNIVEQQRKTISDQVRNHHQNTVAHGPFKGLKLSVDAHWGGADHGAMVLGLYEQEILNDLAVLEPKRKVFIDLGAADGYYGIGALVGGLFEKSYGYEITEKGQQVMAQNAALNNVADKLIIRGEATRDFYKDIPAEERADCALLVDIEGGEFDIIDADTFAAFSKAVVFIELHEWFPDIAQKIEKMKADSAATHSVRTIVMGARDMSAFPELKSMNDTNRWLLCAEGRPYLMSWLRFDPL